MEGKRRGVLSLVLVPALITLGITVLRLVGELKQWDPTWFGKPEAGGSNALLGISWLMFVFGLYFGVRLTRSGAGPRSRKKALVLSLVAIAAVLGCMFALQAADLLSIPDQDHPGEARGMGFLVGTLALGCAITAIAWGRAAWTLFVYALLARIPVVIVTWIALGQDEWNTHYTKVAPFFTNATEANRSEFLIMPQITFWPAMTVILGTVMACLGALLSGKPKAA